ncbi:photosystem II assembly protein Psb34 [Roseofilum capinflatum]|uniref:Ssl1498 family light-harvesting-like protein n=1 Tax=Roseofilum capinflatum BLCC-M114 TaxID=3022440 RepID=A0ABT7BDJ4_9CYAN|nr:ssl1498 family light-harvesting-like protein [Roseofilum capinflatum]MDJ1176857.1 ssl1498 family light-harvesting-like protein [Roseofilum capinflatum BLCC-M114]
MPYTTEEGGRLNNFAREPKVYQAEPPTQSQKTQYAIMGGIAAVFVGLLFFISFAVS